MNRSSYSTSASRQGFTLVEMLVATAVLALLVVLFAQIMNGATAATSTSRRHMDADSQARMIFDRMANDFDKMFDRTDVDFVFAKQTGNDAMFFYSEAPSYFDNTSLAVTQQSNVALIGYRINISNALYPNIPVLERLGKGLTWDGQTTSINSPGGVVFLTASGAIPLATTTLNGNWTTIGTLTGSSGANSAYSDGTDSDYHVLSDQAFRLEFVFLLTDGTVSTIPVTNPGTATNLLTAVSDPTTTCDSAAGYAVGSRWFNATTGRGYICTSAAAGAAAWNPIGIQDISAIIVGIAILDSNSRKIVSFTSTVAASMIGALTDPAPSNPTTGGLGTSPVLMAQTWQNAINSSNAFCQQHRPPASRRRPSPCLPAHILPQ